jgi:hypothetical protein
MPIIDGKYYANDDPSWWDELVDKLSPKQPPPPPPPAPPSPPATITPGTPQYKLMQAQDAARTNPAYKPHPSDNPDAAFCNFATCDISKAVGAPMKDLYYGKRYALTNEAAEQLPSSSEWHEVLPKDAQNLANQGTLVVGVQPNPYGHGHMVTVRPETMPGLAASLGQAPIVNNIGEQRNVVPAEQAFDNGLVRPRYYAPNKR